MPEALATTDLPAPVVDPPTRTVLDAVDDALALTAPDLLRIRHDDFPRLLLLAKNIWRIREIWDADSLANPMGWFASQYANPYNLVFDVCDGAGVLAFIKTVPGWMTQVYTAIWDRRGMRRADLLIPGARVAAMAWDLQSISAFINLDNTKSLRLTERAGMRYRGLVKSGVYCAPGGKPLRWYELTRSDLDLPDVEV